MSDDERSEVEHGAVPRYDPDTGEDLSPAHRAAATRTHRPPHPRPPDRACRQARQGAPHLRSRPQTGRPSGDTGRRQQGASTPRSAGPAARRHRPRNAGPQARRLAPRRRADRPRRHIQRRADRRLAPAPAGAPGRPAHRDRDEAARRTEPFEDDAGRPHVHREKFGLYLRRNLALALSPEDVREGLCALGFESAEVWWTHDDGRRARTLYWRGPADWDA
jgi:hypothetical protein